MRYRSSVAHSRMVASIAFASGLLVLLTSGCGRSEGNVAAEPAQESGRAPVKVLAVRPETAPVLVPFTGTVQAENVVKVAAQIPGKVLAIDVREGQDVAAGAVLLSLDGEEMTLRVQQATRAHEAAAKRLEQLRVVADIEEKSLALGVKQAEEALRQMQARAQIVETGARPQEKEQVEALVDMARTRMESTRREMDRMRPLYESEVIPKQSLEQLEDGYKLAEAQYRQATEQLQLVRIGARKEDREAIESAVQQAGNAVEMARLGARRVEATRLEIQTAELAIEQARLALELATVAAGYVAVKAPCAGRVEQILVEQGSVVGAGIPIVVMIEAGKTEIALLLREEDRQLLANDAAATFTVDALAGEGPFAGTVKQLGEVADPMSGQFPVKIAPDGAVQPRLKGGMFARGAIQAGSKPGALLVPLEAVLRAEGRRILYVVEDDVAHKRFVQTGLRYPDRVEVTDGLQPGQQVVVDGQVGLIDGTAVRVTE